MPFPDNSDLDYIAGVADEVERLIRASNGHAAVLFTSYKVMDAVYNLLEHRDLPNELFMLERASSEAIGRFRASGNGVLFATGALWEGIDIPGDALSMLIIVKLPFAVPDPISGYEQAQYERFADYRDSVLVPDMLIKLKQGFGRLIRTEFDTGCVAILDSRVNTSYYDCVLNALPNCYVTSAIAEVEGFLRLKKPEQYWALIKI